jgi:hypothetical protein
MKEIEQDTNKWKDSTYSWIRRINSVKISILPKVIYRSNASSVKMLTFLQKIEEKYPEISMDPQKPQNIKKNLEQN